MKMKTCPIRTNDREVCWRASRPVFSWRPQTDTTFAMRPHIIKNVPPKRVYDFSPSGFANATVQLWRKTKRDDDLSDSEDEGEGGQRSEKDQSMKASSKKPSGEVSME